MTICIIYRYQCDLEGCDNFHEYTNNWQLPLPEGWVERHYREESGYFNPVTTKHFCSEDHAETYKDVQMPDYYVPLG